MLLKGARVITYGAAFVALGILMVLISTYTPLGKRVIFLVSGMPVLAFSRVAGFRAGTLVYGATALGIFMLVNPVRGLGYLLLSGGVPMLLAIKGIPRMLVGAATLALSLLYLGVSVQVLGIPLWDMLGQIEAKLPWFNPYLTAAVLLTILSYLYPIALTILARELERHWVFEQIFKN